MFVKLAELKPGDHDVLVPAIELGDALVKAHTCRLVKSLLTHKVAYVVEGKLSIVLDFLDLRLTFSLRRKSQSKIYPGGVWLYLFDNLSYHRFR